MHHRRHSSAFLLLTVLALARPASAQEDVVRIGPGVTPPRITYKVEPEFSPEARNAGVQGTVVFQVIVDEQGKLDNVSVLSPLGFGLDELAQEAIEKWRFVPGQKEGHAVKVLATIEVNFRFIGLPFDDKAESRRTKFNIAIEGMKSQDAKRSDQAVKTIQDLARQKFPPAMHLLGRLTRAGQHVSKDLDQALILTTAAADKKYGPALFDLGILYMEGDQVPHDSEKGMRFIREASVLGSSEAQYDLGLRYEAGSGVPKDAGQARRYFRLCAARGDHKCQFRLGRLLLNAPERQERDYVQAVAWLQLAADRGDAAAKTLSETETSKLTASQIDWISKLKPQLVRPH